MTKKFLYSILFIFVTILCSVGCNKVNLTNNQQLTQKAISAPNYSNDKSKSVYITPTGARYHYKKTCAGKNSYLSTIDKARKLGLTGCKKCT